MEKLISVPNYRKSRFQAFNCLKASILFPPLKAVLPLNLLNKHTLFALHPVENDALVSILLVSGKPLIFIFRKTKYLGNRWK